MTHTVALSVFPKKNQLAPGPNSSKYGIQFYQTFRNVMKMYLCTLTDLLRKEGPKSEIGKIFS